MLQLTRMAANLQQISTIDGKIWHELCKPHVIAGMWCLQQASSACNRVQLLTHLDSLCCCMLASKTRVVTHSLLSRLRKCADASNSIHRSLSLVYWSKKVIIMLAICLLAQVIEFKAREAKRSKMPRLLRTFSSLKKERYAFCLLSCLPKGFQRKPCCFPTCLLCCLVSCLVPCPSSRLLLHT